MLPVSRAGSTARSVARATGAPREVRLGSDSLPPVAAPAVINLHEIAPRSVAEGDIAFKRRRLGRAAGASRIGASWFEVPAGRRQMPVHVHGEEEEIFYVLAGDGLGWEKDEGYEVAEGDAIVHRPNAKPHTFLAGDGGLTLLAFDSGSNSHLTFLPRAGVMWAGPRWVPLDGPHPFKAEALAGPVQRPEIDRTHPRPANVVGLHDVGTGPFAERSARRRARSRPVSTTSRCGPECPVRRRTFTRWRRSCSTCSRARAH